MGKMKINKQVVLISLILGVFVGIIDTVLDHIYFYKDQTFVKLLVFDVPEHEIYIRTVILFCFIVFGLITGRIITRLDESNERYQRLTENAVDMIYRMKLPEATYEYVSPASTMIFGYTPQEFYDSPILFKKVIHPDWQDYFAKHWERLLRGDMPPYYEYRIIHKSGEPRWLNQRNVLVKDDFGEPIAIEGIITDITEKKKVEEERENLIDELQKLLAEIKTLRGIIPICAHCKEIRDDEGYWDQIESYISKHSNATFSHGICPDCAKKHFSDLVDGDVVKKRRT